MAAQLDVDREAVRVLVVAVGPREAARQMGLSENTVLQWTSRFGWLDHTKAVPQLPTSMQKQAVIGVIKPADALANSLKEDALATRVGLTRYAKRMAVQAETAGILEEAPLYKAVADIHAKMHPEAQGEHVLNIGYFSIMQPMQPEGPIVDMPIAEP